MIGVLAKNDNLNPSANLAAGDTTVMGWPAPPTQVNEDSGKGRRVQWKSQLLA